MSIWVERSVRRERIYYSNLQVKESDHHNNQSASLTHLARVDLSFVARNSVIFYLDRTWFLHRMVIAEQKIHKKNIRTTRGI